MHEPALVGTINVQSSDITWDDIFSENVTITQQDLPVAGTKDEAT